MSLKMSVLIFRVVTSHSPVDSYEHFGNGGITIQKNTTDVHSYLIVKYPTRTDLTWTSQVTDMSIPPY